MIHPLAVARPPHLPEPIAADPGGLVPLVLDEETARKARRILDDGVPPNTRAAYSADLAYFWGWARVVLGLAESYPVAPETMVRFLTDHAEGMDPEHEETLVREGIKRDRGPHAINTVLRRLYAISAVHDALGLPSPVRDRRVKLLASRARKAMARRGFAPRKKRAAVRSVLDAMLATCEGDRMTDIRDRALLLYAWSSGGRRRSEVAEAVFERLAPVDGSYVYTLGVTKTDQDGEGGDVPVAGRAAEAMREWLSASGVTSGPLFRPVSKAQRVLSRPLTPHAVGQIVKKRAMLAGLDPSEFGGHSLRSGFITEGGMQGRSLFDLMPLSRHKTVQVAMGYYQAGAALTNPASRMAD